MLPVTILSPDVLPAAARWLDLAGLAVFAASGALAAAKRGQTVVTAIFFGLITGVGGGTAPNRYAAAVAAHGKQGMSGRKQR